MASIADELEVAARELPGVERRGAAGSVEYLRKGQPFAIVEARTASFRLAPDVAAAALRTPGTAASPRGTDWVALDLSSPDRFTVDRARAWLVSASRIAGGRR